MLATLFFGVAYNNTRWYCSTKLNVGDLLFEVTHNRYNTGIHLLTNVGDTLFEVTYNLYGYRYILIKMLATFFLR